MNPRLKGLVALAAGLALFALVALVGDYAIKDYAAGVGAQAGSAQLDMGAFQASSAAQLDWPAAIRECERIIALDVHVSPQGNITCTTGEDGTGVYVDATVSDRFQVTHRSYLAFTTPCAGGCP